MSKFDFAKLREQIKQTNESLKEIYKGTDNHIKAAQERFLNPESRSKLSQSISKKQNEKDYLDHMSKQRLASMDKPIDDTGITLREKLKEANRKSAKNPEHYANRVKANRRQKNDPKWKEAHAKGVLNYSEETQTPSGVYQSMSSWMKEHNRPGARMFLKSLPHLFYQTKNGPGEATYERIYNTPFGQAASDYYAYKLCQQNQELNSLKLKNIAGWWLKMAALFPDQYSITFSVAKYWPLEKSIPYGMLELESKPRISKDNLEKVINTWNKRLINQKKLYKK